MATTPVFLPGESQGQGSLVGSRLWGCTESDTTETTQQQQQQQEVGAAVRFRIGPLHPPQWLGVLKGRRDHSKAEYLAHHRRYSGQSCCCGYSCQ